MRRRTSTLATLAVVVTSLACSNNDKAPQTSQPLMKNGFVVGAVPTGAVDASFKVAPHEALPVTPDAAPFFISTLTKKVEVSAQAQVDPDLAVIAEGRASAASCFNGVPNGPPRMSGLIRVTVVPSGAVTRSEATASTSDPGVINCLEEVGEGLRFSDESDKPTADIRTYSIDVLVNRTQ